MSQQHYEEMVQLVQRAQDVGGAIALLGWDQRTHMPRQGGKVRAERIATLVTILHEMLTSDELVAAIDGAESYAKQHGEGSVEFRTWEMVKRRRDKTELVPVDLSAEISRAHSLAAQAWDTARKNDDWDSFKPFLQRNIDLMHEELECVRPYYPDAKDDYDILLDDYEQGLPTSEVARVFEEFKVGARPLVERVIANRDDRENLVKGSFDPETQDALIRKVLPALGFDDTSWDLAETTHPFESSMAIEDIRITTKYDPDFFNPCFFGSMHEFGHGLYERQINTEYDRTPLARGISMAWHESQSRMWENLVGRGRPFWTWAQPLVAEAFPAAFGSASADDIYRAVNAMGPSLIRIESDELTYNYHIILRFELEREILAGNLTVDDLPEAWNAKIQEYLGIDVPNAADGVLQDVHWSQGSFGYFPTYALGNMVAAQLWEKILAENAGIEDEFAEGNFATLRGWLGENIHQYGSLYKPMVLMERVLGTNKLDAQPQLRYLGAKVNELYG